MIEKDLIGNAEKLVVLSTTQNDASFTNQSKILHRGVPVQIALRVRKALPKKCSSKWNRFGAFATQQVTAHFFCKSHLIHSFKIKHLLIKINFTILCFHSHTTTHLLYLSTNKFLFPVLCKNLLFVLPDFFYSFSCNQK